MDPLLTGALGALTVLLATARAATQCRDVFTPEAADAAVARRCRQLGALSAIVGVAYGHLIGADQWLMCAAWLNTASSVIATYTRLPAPAQSTRS